MFFIIRFKSLPLLAKKDDHFGGEEGAVKGDK
jgi:hypothetical protein